MFNEVELNETREEPQFLVQRCPCGKPDCDTIVFAMINPVLKEIEGREDSKLASVLHFPKAHIPTLVIKLMEEMER